MKLYLQRFVHHVGGLPDFKALRFTKYNQYESMILPMVKYLESAEVDFQYGVEVKDVAFDIKQGKKQAKRILVERAGKAEAIDLIEDDLVFITNGCCTDSTAYGDQDHAPVVAVKDGEGESWRLWKNIAKQDPSFGRPEKFCSDIQATKWESATVTTLDERIPAYIEKICKRDPFSGKVTTGGIVTVRDSGWYMSWTVNRQPQFREQPKGQVCVWVYGLYPDRPGDFVKKPMKDCSGMEIAEEWLYHMGVPEAEIAELAKDHANTVPTMMPYITAFFMPRAKGDRPDVVPRGAVNFAFLGQFAETARDCIFTTEYSIRTAMEAVYTLLDVDRGVPEVWASAYDVRALLDASVKMMDGRKPVDMKLPFPMGIVKKAALKKIDKTVVGDLLRKYKAI